ncbi:hypothetical protein KI387_001301, partial [Taxus chinensis]
VSHFETNQDEKFDVPPEPMVDGYNDEIKVFYFPSEEEDSFHDEEIVARSHEAFEDEAPLDKGLIECSDSQDNELTPPNSSFEQKKRFFEC